MGPEKDLLNQVKQALKGLSIPVFYDGHPHKAVYPQVIIDFQNNQERPEILRGVEVIKSTISVDVYTYPEDLADLLDLGRQATNLVKQVQCEHWESNFDSYSGRILDDESNEGRPLKRDALLFNFFVYSIRKESDK